MLGKEWASQSRGAAVFKSTEREVVTKNVTAEQRLKGHEGGAQGQPGDEHTRKREEPGAKALRPECAPC